MPLHPFEPPRGRIERFEIESKALAGNMLGDPTRRGVAVYLPASYDAGDAEFPLIVELAAFTSSGPKRLGWQAFAESVPQRIDRLVAEKKMPPVVAAFPDCFTSLGGNQYVDSPVTGRWEEFLVDEMLSAIESRYRVRRSRRSRAVFGKSSGGYGALIQGMRHADRWAAVACHSGDIGFDTVYRRDLPATLDVLAEHGGSVERFLEQLKTAPRIGGREMHALLILALAASYDPDPSAAAGVRLPADLETAELIPERWERWLEHDPLRLVETDSNLEGLRALEGLYFDCGNRDEYFLHYGARALARRLERAGVRHRYEEFEGTHSGIDHRLDVSLPYLSRLLD